MFKGIIFDFNGTLYDDTDLQEEAWAVMTRKYLGRDLGPTEFRDCFYGLGNTDILNYLNRERSGEPLTLAITDEKEAEYRRICRQSPKRVKFIPGVTDLFDRLTSEGIPMAIATASEITNVEFYFEMFALERWFPMERVVYDTGAFPCKPAPDIFLEAARRLDCPIGDCMICEDSLNGLRGAIASGAGRVIARRLPINAAGIVDDPNIYAVIDDFTGFYEKYVLQ